MWSHREERGKVDGSTVVIKRKPARLERGVRGENGSKKERVRGERERERKRRREEEENKTEEERVEGRESWRERGGGEMWI